MNKERCFSIVCARKPNVGIGRDQHTFFVASLTDNSLKGHTTVSPFGQTNKRQFSGLDSSPILTRHLHPQAMSELTYFG
jgi:hypothetical protein